MFEIENFIEKSPLIPIVDVQTQNAQVFLWLKAEHLIHRELAGNKFRKLYANLLQAKKLGYDTLLTFGGAFSNHIFATAAAGKYFGFKTIGMIRGEEHLPLNHTLSFAQKCQMNLHYIDRTTYRQKNELLFLENLKQQFGNFYILPEGGSNELALKGVAQMVVDTQTQIDFNYICTPCGTGATLAGLISALAAKQYALGFAVLKNASFLIEDVKKLLSNTNPSFSNDWNVFLDYHFGGYAKKNQTLIDFKHWFEQKHQIELDDIYTAKMVFGVYDLMQRNYFPPQSNIVMVHTGGLQKISV